MHLVHGHVCGCSDVTRLVGEFWGSVLLARKHCVVLRDHLGRRVALVDHVTGKAALVGQILLMLVDQHSVRLIAHATYVLIICVYGQTCLRGHALVRIAAKS